MTAFETTVAVWAVRVIGLSVLVAGAVAETAREADDLATLGAAAWGRV